MIKERNRILAIIDQMQADLATTPEASPTERQKTLAVIEALETLRKAIVVNP